MRMGQHLRPSIAAGLLIALFVVSVPAAPVADAQEAACQPPLAPRLVIDQQGTAVRGLNIRARPQGDWIATIRPGATFNIVDGPRPVVDEVGDCLVWWYVYVYSLDLLGWVAEGWGDYWIAPLGVPAAPKGAGAAGAINPADLGGELLKSDFGEVIEWGVFRPGAGYITLGWTWPMPDGSLGCSVPATGAVMTPEALCALVRSRAG